MTARTRRTGSTTVDAKTRAHMVELYRAGQSFTAVARETGRAKTTVAKILHDEIPDEIRAPSTAQAVAVEARRATAKDRRAAISEGLLDDVEELRRRLWERPQVVGLDDDDLPIIAVAPNEPREIQRLMTSIGIAIDKHLVIVRHDSDDKALPEVDQYLEAMLNGGAR